MVTMHSARCLWHLLEIAIVYFQKRELQLHLPTKWPHEGKAPKLKFGNLLFLMEIFGKLTFHLVKK